MLLIWRRKGDLNPCAFYSLRAFQARLFSHLSIPPLMVHPTWIEHATLTFGGLRSNPTELRVHIMSQSLFYQITLHLSNIIFIFSTRKDGTIYFILSLLNLTVSIDKFYDFYGHNGIIIFSMKSSS